MNRVEERKRKSRIFLFTLFYKMCLVLVFIAYYFNLK